VTDRVAVLRQGRKVADVSTQDISANELVGFITGGHVAHPPTGRD
jgi:ABC-type sugar transport system ATPase subunit